MQVNSYRNFESKKKHIRQHKINTCDSWWYIEVLWSWTIGLCKKLNIIYYIITCNPELQNQIRHYSGSFWVLSDFQASENEFWLSKLWVTFVLLALRTVSDASVRFSELVQKKDSFVKSLQTNCLRLWITGNNVVNNVQFIAQTDCFAS